IFLAKFAIERIRKGAAIRQITGAALGSNVTEEYQLLRLPHRQTPKQDSVQQTEDRRICSDAEGQRQDCNHDEAGALIELAQGIAQILPHVIPTSKDNIPACWRRLNGRLLVQLRSQ